MKPTEIRLARLRELIERQSVGKLSKALGYSQPSFLSQLAGPNPTREITEKTARRFEEKLGLPNGYFDTMEDQAPPAKSAPAASSGDAELVADVIRLVGSIMDGEKVSLPPVKFADVVALAYVDTVEHGKKPRPDHIKQIVRLLK